MGIEKELKKLESGDKTCNLYIALSQLEKEIVRKHYGDIEEVQNPEKRRDLFVQLVKDKTIYR